MTIYKINANILLKDDDEGFVSPELERAGRIRKGKMKYRLIETELNRSFSDGTSIRHIIGRSKTARGIMRQWNEKVGNTAKIHTCFIHYEGVGGVEIEETPTEYIIRNTDWDPASPQICVAEKK